MIFLGQKSANLVVFTPFVFFFNFLHFFFGKIIFDVEVLKKLATLLWVLKYLSNFVGTFAPNLIGNCNASIVEKFWNVEVVGSNDNF